MVRKRENIQWAADVWTKMRFRLFQAAGGVKVWGIFSWHTLGPFVPIEHSLNATAYLSIVADHVHPFMTTVYPSSDVYFQQDKAPCHTAQLISDLNMTIIPFSTKAVSVMVRSQSLVSNWFFVFRHPKYQLWTRKSSLWVAPKHCWTRKKNRLRRGLGAVLPWPTRRTETLNRHIWNSS